MRAVVITSHGGVEGIGVQEVETPPKPTADRVRVRVYAAGLNRADILQRQGKYPAPRGYPQNIPGLEFAGEVETIGEEVRSWKVGQRVDLKIFDFAGLCRRTRLTLAGHCSN